MATVIITGNAQVEQQHEEEFVAKVGDAVTSALGLPSNLKSIHFYPLAASRFTKKDKPELTFTPRPIKPPNRSASWLPTSARRSTRSSAKGR